jgi:general secretion pathway protein D
VGAGAPTETTAYGSAPVTTGVKFQIVPQHIGDLYVKMDVTPTVNGIAGLGASRLGTFAPIQTVRSAKTQVVMRDGETLVIGGLFTNNRYTEKAKTPVLSEIPVLGNLFTRTRETTAKTELVIMITPRIVRKTADVGIIVPPEELKRLEAKEEEEKVPCRRSIADVLGVPPAMRKTSVK